MALISLSDWIDRFGDEPDDAGPGVEERLTYRVDIEPAAAPRLDYRITTVLPIGSEIAATRTRLL
jgi:hypothetical protein